MDVHNSLKFAISSGNVYCRCDLESQKKKQEMRKKRLAAQEQSMADKRQGLVIEQQERGRPP